MLSKLFYVAIGLCLSFNFVGDLSVYRENQIEARNGEWVQRSYETIQSVDSVRIKLLESQLNGSPAIDLSSSLEQLAALTLDMPWGPRVQNLKELDSGQLIARTNNAALSLLTEISIGERTLLNERIRSDVASNNSANIQIVLANIIDLILIAIAFLFFYHEKKLARKMQGALTSALAHVETVNQSLLERMSRKDSQFKMTVHDLKNPLGSIRGFAELLQDETGNNISTLEMVQIIKRISNSTLRLVDTALAEHEEEDAHTVEEVKVFDCLKETCLFLEPIARKKKQNIFIDKDSNGFVCKAAKHKIQDVFYNVVSNALKYSPPHSNIYVSCKAEDGDHRVIVRDQGPGFAREDFSRMFQAGVKLSAKPTAGENSTGIGLYSVKNTIESIKGRIDVRNNEDGGACVTIQFPNLA